jgi:hypothetical protein
MMTSDASASQGSARTLRIIARAAARRDPGTQIFDKRHV